MTFEPAIWLYKPLSVTYPKATGMTQNVAAIPTCIVCKRHSPLPPARLGFLSDGGEVALFQICTDCVRGRDSDAELEPLVLNAIRRAEAPAAWAVRPAHQEQSEPAV
jgi:hypothetical protein